MVDIPSILLVDDDESFNKRLIKAFKKRGYIVFGAGNYEEAISAIEKYRPAFGVFDLRLPGKSGLEIIRDGLKINSVMKIVVLTGYGSPENAQTALELGAHAFLSKPVDIVDIINALPRLQAR